MKYLTWHRTTSSRSASSRNLLGVNPTDDVEDLTKNLLDSLSMVSRSHASTLDRLYAWERKLYDEVKVSLIFTLYNFFFPLLIRVWGWMVEQVAVASLLGDLSLDIICKCLSMSIRLLFMELQFNCYENIAKISLIQLCRTLSFIVHRILSHLHSAVLNYLHYAFLIQLHYSVLTVTPL